MNWMKKLYSDMMENNTEIDHESFNLTFFRFVYCLAIAYYLFAYKRFVFQFETNVYESFLNFDYYRSTILFGIPLFYLIRYFLILFLILTAIGIFTGFSSIASAFLLFFYLKPIFNLYRLQSIDLIFFTLIAFFLNKKSHHHISLISKTNLTPKIHVGTQASKLFISIIAFAYFHAGMSKFINGDLYQLLDGRHYSNAFYYIYLSTDAKLSLMFAQSRYIRPFFTMCAIIWELGFVLTLIKPKLLKVFAIFGIFFHFGVFLLMDINFFDYFIWSYLVLINWSSILHPRVIKKIWSQKKLKYKFLLFWKFITINYVK